MFQDSCPQCRKLVAGTMIIWKRRKRRKMVNLNTGLKVVNVDSYDYISNLKLLFMAECEQMVTFRIAIVRSF